MCGGRLPGIDCGKMKLSRVWLVLAGLIVAWFALRHGPARPSAPTALSDGSDAKLTGGLAPGAWPGAAGPTASPDFPRDEVESSHPVERAVAGGVVLDTRIGARAAGGWSRVRLVQTTVQPRPVRVEEDWALAPGGRWECRRRDMYLADQLIVTTAPGFTVEQLKPVLASLGMQLEGQVMTGVFTVRLARADLDAAPAALDALAARPDVALAAELDGVGFGAGLPNDASFGSQWGLRNTGQSGGAVGADVNAEGLWNRLESAPGVIVAVLDSGLNFTHPDLQGVAWTNPGEVADDGIDNDGNGRIDDVTGWDFTNSDDDPTDDHGHGSNVTGIVAANRNDGTGVAGLIGGVQVVVCKILNANNSGFTSHLIAATSYARERGVSVMNLSLQNYPFNSTLNIEFTACQNAGILLSICAGNQGVNNDVTPNYPSSYTHDAIVAVGNHDRTDARWSGTFNPSNYGATSVDLFAPGREILSPILGTNYSYYTGTSQATPFVTALAAALKYLHPTWQAAEIKQRILSAVTTRAAYSGLCVTGGRLNAGAAVERLGQTITFEPLADRPFGSADFSVSAIATSGLPVSIFWVSGPATVAGSTVSLTGVGTVTLRASQPGDVDTYAASDVDRSFIVTANFLSWQFEHFSAEERANSAISGYAAVLGHDGLSNLVKYALGLAPRATVASGSPTVTMNGNEWIYRYLRPSGTTDLVYVVEASTDLVTWSAAEVTQVHVETGGGTETWEGRYPAAAAPQLFFRLRVSRP